MATAGIQLGSAVLKVGLAELAAHSARLQAAKSENASIPPVVAAFDADVATIVNAFNTGAATGLTCAQACAAVDNNIQANLKQQVGKAGTSWSAITGMQGKCDKTCTAGCCVYYGDLGPVLSMIALACNGAPLIAQWGANDPRYTAKGNGAQITVPEVFASKYGGQDRPSYQISLTKPNAVVSAQASILATVQSLVGETETETSPSPSETLGSILGTPPIQQSTVVTGTVGGISVSMLLIGVAILFFAALAFVFVEK